jgi:hypothetical protein
MNGIRRPDATFLIEDCRWIGNAALRSPATGYIEIDILLRNSKHGNGIRLKSVPKGC